MDIDNIFCKTVMYKDLVDLTKFLYTFNLRCKIDMEQYKMASPFWKSDEKTFWLFEGIIHDEAERIRHLCTKKRVKTRRSVELPLLLDAIDTVMEHLLKVTNDVKAKSINSRCVVCYENEICVNVGPCGHFIICQSCSNRLSTCPMCRANRY
jgi:hypothetical protein